MATRQQQLQAMIRMYREETGKTTFDMNDIAEFCEIKKWRMPRAKTPRELLARELSAAAAAEYRHDPNTGRAYRANHAMNVGHGPKQMTLWFDVDQATRKQMDLSLKQQRNQVVGTLYQMVVDSERWNSTHLNEEPLQVPLDFDPDIRWKMNEPLDKAG